MGFRREEGCLRSGSAEVVSFTRAARRIKLATLALGGC